MFPSLLGAAADRVAMEGMTFFAAGVGTLGIWAALSRRHWLVRTSAVLLAVMALLPIRAFEPFLLFLVAASATTAIMVALRWRFSAAMTIRPGDARDRPTQARISLRTALFACAVFFLMGAGAWFRSVQHARGVGNWLWSVLWRAWRIGGWFRTDTTPLYRHAWTWWEWLVFGSQTLCLVILTTRLLRAGPFAVSVTEGSLGATSRRFRFSLRGLMLVVLLVGVAVELTLKWPGLVGTGACVVLVTVAAACVVLFRRGSVILAAALPLAVATAAALHAWVVPDWMELWYFHMIDEPWEAFHWFLSAFALLGSTVLVFSCFLLIGGAFDERPGDRGAREWPATAVRVMLCCIVLAAYGPLAVVYYRMSGNVAPPEYSLPETNSYPQVLAAVTKLYRLNPGEATMAAIRDGGDPAKSKEIAEVYRELFELLQQPAFVSLDWERKATRDEEERVLLKSLQMFRSVARTLEQESSAAQAAQRFDEAADFGLANLRMGSAQQKGGVIVWTLLGIGIEGLGVSQVSRVRKDLSTAETRRLVTALEAIERDREPPAVTFSREAAWAARQQTWRHTFAREAPVVLAAMKSLEYGVSYSEEGGVLAVSQTIERRDVWLRLLKTDLAIRWFRSEAGRLPESLHQLVPRYVSAVPLDPYSLDPSSPLPLVYRRQGDTYQLYSVGRDRNDDGGRSDLYRSNFDVDLDAIAGLSTATPSSAGAGP